VKHSITSVAEAGAIVATVGGVIVDNGTRSRSSPEAMLKFLTYFVNRTAVVGTETVPVVVQQEQVHQRL
jgi:hypothetical protein